MLESLSSLISFTAIALTAWGLGRPVVRRSQVADERGFLAHVWSCGLGLALAGGALTFLGFVGWLNVTLLQVLTVAGCGWAIGQLVVDLRRRTDQTENVPPSDNLSPMNAPPRWWQRGLVLAVIFALAGSLVSALAPPTAGDALCYHLELPKRFLQAEAIAFVPWHDNATFPLLTEMWFAWGMALEGAVTAQLIHWGLGVLFAAAATCLARELLGKEWAWTVGAISLLVPGVTNQMTVPLNDIALAAFATLAVIAWRRCLFHDEASELPGQQSKTLQSKTQFTWILRAGLMTGATLAIKYVALMFVAAMAAATAWQLVRRKVAWRPTVASATVVMLIALTLAGAWYLRAAVHRGNPVFPFFASIWGDSTTPETLRESKLPLGWNAMDIASAPWQLTMNPADFGGRGHQVGCLFLALLPGLLFVRKLRGLAFLLQFAASYFLVWYAMRQNLRFFLPAVPPLAIAITWVVAEMGRAQVFLRTTMAGTVAGVLGLTALLPIYRARHHVQVAVGVESREAYLLRTEPTYAAASYSQLHLPADSTILSQEFRLFYFPQPVTRENIYRRETAYHRDLQASHISAKLRSEGYSHVLLAESLDDGIHYNNTLSQLIATAESLAPESVDELLAYEIAGADGALRHYRLIELR